MIIYKITNLLNGKIYIGKDSKNNPNYFGSGVYIWRSIKKHGKENFVKEVICECSSKEELNEKEKYWIEELDSRIPNGYNISAGGESGSSGCIWSEESKMKLRKPLSEERKKKMKEAANRPERLEKNRSSRSEEARKNMKLAREKCRKPLSEETKKNMKLARNRPEVKEKMRKSRSEEAKKNIKEAVKKAMSRPEVKEKMRKPKSEEGKINIQLAQQKRRDLEKSKKELYSDSI